MKNKEPELRLLGFDESWEIRMLKDIFNILDGDRGKNYPGEADFHKEGHTLFLDTGNVRKNGFLFSNKKYISEEKDSSLKNGQLKLNDFVLTSRGTLGNVAFYDELVQSNYPSVRINSAMLILRPKLNDLVSNKYLEAVLRGNLIEKFINKNKVGSAQPHITKGEFSKVNIGVPASIVEQKKIGSFFKDLDDTIALHQQELEVLKQAKHGFLQKMFPEEGMTIPEIRFSEFHEQWELKTLGEVLDSIYNGQTPSRNRKDFWNGNINWLSSGELNRGVVKTTIEKITEFGQRNANLKIVPKNTFVIAITGLEAAGTRGNCAILGMETTINQSCMALFPKKNLLDTTFLFQWYRKVGEKYGLRFTQGTKQQSYNAEIIKKLEICLPSVEEQIKIGKFFRKLDKIIELKEKELEALKETKKGFLQKMFV